VKNVQMVSMVTLSLNLRAIVQHANVLSQVQRSQLVTWQGKQYLAIRMANVNVWTMLKEIIVINALLDTGMYSLATVVRNVTVIQMDPLVKIVTSRLDNVNADLVSLEGLAINVLLDISNSQLMDAKLAIVIRTDQFIRIAQVMVSVCANQVSLVSSVINVPKIITISQSDVSLVQNVSIWSNWQSTNFGNAFQL